MPDDLNALIDFTKDEDARTRALAIAGLAKVHDPRGFAPVVVALFDPVDEVRVTAATALGILGDDRAFEPLEVCLGDSSEEVGVHSAWALGQIPSSRCLDKILEVMNDAENYSSVVRAAAATAVGERSEKSGSDIATRDEVIERAREALIQACRDEHGEVRAAAMWSCGHLPANEVSVEAAIQMLDDEEEWAVRYAIEALAHFKDARAVEPLKKYSESSNEDIRVLAIQALEALK